MINYLQTKTILDVLMLDYKQASTQLLLLGRVL
ncbi:hypothetical protein VPHK122_0028 [Vibrio phage K122]|nr:hypothetical protein VP115E341_P0026 [Vibrio phage 115E34-1]CAH9013383.1 hypothetical protein VP455E521_P0027 [Vibrio phage 455E52-1]CAH9015209.1 hypothetical protein VP466E531_P0024 [Vibrio phage 466E53-1]CAH9015287.1 hypothetical protein VP511E551_P0030 [Vibrio phage 511E55-1]CAH9015910.1 hypothetical protein VP120E341_P0026 [Vibrio phage 120E34-1]CAH9016342.1 hypothetical protein VP217E381_P0028 [Vibrio phage 217E38-1]